MNVAITGATGVVGSAVLRHLRESGRPIRALVRKAARPLAPDVQTVVGDLLDYRSLVVAFEASEVVYHAAGLNQMCPRRPEDLFRVNVEGTRNVVRACRAAGVRRLVYTSSAATIGEGRGSVGREDTAHRGHFNSWYERSKYEAEQVARMEAGPLQLVVVNPSSVQGPGRSTGTGKLILDLINGRLPVLVETRFSIIDIDDCARGHLLAETDGSPGDRYLLSGFTITTKEAVALVEAILGRRLGVKMMPGWLAMAGAAAIEAINRIMGRQAPVCREMVRTLRHGHSYDGAKATRELGLVYTPPEQVLARLIGWFTDEGLLR
jgi:dihydroflavonol-4-reductase